MNRTFALSAAALFLTLGIVPCVARAEDEETPAPPAERPERMQRRGPGREGALGVLTEEERAKLTELVKNVGDALAAYKANPTDETKAALKTQVSAAFEFRQKLMIDRAEKALAKAKERLQNKDEEVNKQVERLIQQRKERPERPERPEEPPRAEMQSPFGGEGFGAPMRAEMQRPFGGEGFGAPMRAAMADGERGPRGPRGPMGHNRPDDPLLFLLMPETPAPTL